MDLDNRIERVMELIKKRQEIDEELAPLLGLTDRPKRAYTRRKASETASEPQT